MDKKMTLFTLTWPIFIETFLRLSLGNVNVFMLSQFSDNAVGAVGVSNQVIMMVVMLYSIVGTGTTVIINQYLGSEDRKTASNVAVVALAANFVFGLVMSAVLVIFARGILKAMNLPDELMDYAFLYITIVGGASFTQALMTTMSGIARSYGHTKFPMYVVILMNVLNIIGNYLVIFRPFGFPVFGVAGIATSLVISQFIGLFILAYIIYKKIGIKFSIKNLIPFPIDILKDIVKIGFPSAGEFLSYSGSQIATTYIITMLGTIALTTRVYTQNVMVFVWVMGVSTGQGTMILVGHMIGSNRFNEAYKRAVKSLALAAIADMAVAIVIAIVARPAFNIFTHDQAIIDIGVKLLLITIILEPGRAFNLVIGNALRAAGDVRYPVAMGIISMWFISVLLCYVLGIHFKLGLIGIWIAFTADEWTRGIILYIRWRSRIWQGMSLVKAKCEEQSA